MKMFHWIMYACCLLSVVDGQSTSRSKNNVCCTASLDNVWYKNIQNLILTLKEESCEKVSSAGLPRDCKEILDRGDSHGSGVYDIYNPIDGGRKQVYCDMDTDGGGWLVVQRRINGNVSFAQDWDTYRSGFGELTGNFWLGNEILYRLTNYQKQVLRVELEKWDGEKGYATYNTFFIGRSDEKFNLSIASYEGNIGDSLIECHNGKSFSTPDQDNDPLSGVHCASRLSAGWWYCTCADSSLNGLYYNSSEAEPFDYLGISWHSFGGEGYSHKRSEMKIRPK